MCANYEPQRDPGRWRHAYGLLPPDVTYPPEAWPGYLAPFVRRAPDALGFEREAAVGLFGLVPGWARDLTITRSTYNCRSETASSKPSFREAWRRGQRCVIPASAIYEPNYESGKAVRWRLQRGDGETLSIAGLWSAWRGPDGGSLLSFTMLTVNADAHLFMRRFHKPDDEKRVVALLDPADIDAWLESPIEQAAQLVQQCADDYLTGEPAPLPPRRRSA